MANHRSDTRRRWWHRRRKVGVDALLEDVAPILPDEGAAWSESRPFTLGRTHPWRNKPCALCATVASWRTLRIVTISDCRLPSRASWRVVSASYLICTEHDDMTPNEVTERLHQLEEPGCPCHTVAAADAAAYPFHLAGANHR